MTTRLLLLGEMRVQKHLFQLRASSSAAHGIQSQQLMFRATDGSAGPLTLIPTANPSHTLALTLTLILLAQVLLHGVIVLPHKEIKESILEPGTIIM